MVLSIENFIWTCFHWIVEVISSDDIWYQNVSALLSNWKLCDKLTQVYCVLEIWSIVAFSDYEGALWMLRKLSQPIRPRQSGRRANCQRRPTFSPARAKKKVNPRDKLGRADSREWDSGRNQRARAWEFVQSGVRCCVNTWKATCQPILRMQRGRAVERVERVESTDNAHTSWMARPETAWNACLMEWLAVAKGGSPGKGWHTSAPFWHTSL